MPFTRELPVWAKIGTKPPATMLNTNGWVPGDKPPADWLNWFFNLSYEAIKELQLEALNVDQKGVSSGVATLGIDVKVPTNQLTDASTSAKGIVMLEDSVTSTSIVKAATPKSVKTAYDRADAAFQSANDGKTAVADAVTAKGVAASAADTFSQLAGKIGQIPTGAKIKSVQRNTSVISGTTLTVSITAVNLTRAYLVCEVRPLAGATDPTMHRVRGKLNANSITFTRYASGVDMNIDWYVVEYEYGVTVQRGSGSWIGYHTPPNTAQNANDIAITTIDSAKSFAIVSCSTDATGQELYFWQMSVGFLTSTLLQLYVAKAYANKPNLAYEWQVVSFV